MNIQLARHGFVLILLALVTGFFVPAMVVPRLGLSAHTIGILSGVLLIAMAGIWGYFLLSGFQRSVLYWTWLYSSYANWLGCLIGALMGAGKMTPVASAGREGSAGSELIVACLLGTVALASLMAVALSLWGLRADKARTVASR